MFFVVVFSGGRGEQRASGWHPHRLVRSDSSLAFRRRTRKESCKYNCLIGEIFDFDIKPRRWRIKISLSNLLCGAVGVIALIVCRPRNIWRPLWTSWTQADRFVPSGWIPWWFQGKRRWQGRMAAINSSPTSIWNAVTFRATMTGDRRRTRNLDAARFVKRYTISTFSIWKRATPTNPT